jgi:cold-inducible RNA-binding protein
LSGLKESTEDDIRAAFSSHGEIKSVSVPTDKFTGRPRGFAFVKMSTAEATAAAIAALNETEMGGRTIYVSESLPKEKVGERKKRTFNKNRREHIACFSA